jgi:hypothetical protein
MAVEVLGCCRYGAHPCRKEPRERNEASRGRELGDQREKLLLTGLGKKDPAAWVPSAMAAGG